MALTRCFTAKGIRITKPFTLAHLGLFAPKQTVIEEENRLKAMELP